MLQSTEKSTVLRWRKITFTLSIVVIKVFHSAKPLAHRIRIFIIIAVKCRLKGSVSRYFSKFKQLERLQNWLEHRLNNCSKLKKRLYKWHSKYKSRHQWINLRRIETDCNCGVYKLVGLTHFHNSFLLFVTFDTCLGHIVGHKALISSFIVSFSSSIANKDA